MYFARMILPVPRFMSVANELLNRAELDLLQLDWQRQYPGEDVGSDAPNSNWKELLQVVKGIHTAVYLRPTLRMIVSVGSGYVLKAAETLAEFLIAHGSSALPVAVIRGESLQHDLDGILSAGALSKNQAILSAHVELGAGPLATALADGARIVLAGAYDVSAPLIAAAISSGLCNWQDHERLFAIAAASQFKSVVTELRSDGSVELEPAALEQIDRVRALGAVDHADLCCAYDKASLERTPRNTYQLTNVGGKRNLQNWNVKVMLASGSRAAMLIASGSHGVPALLEHCDKLSHGGIFHCREYRQSLDADPGEPLLLRLEYRHQASERCHEFVEGLQWLLQERPDLGQIVAPSPSIEKLTETMTIAIPADRVTVSVETRPAREWL
jgi:hypothetical protein